jgi:hypothetical protein
MTRFGILLALVALFATACSHQVGDDCKTSVDCDPNGTRSCDLSQPGGYCTIAGCDGKSCPNEAVCIRYFPEMYLSKPCVPACEDLACAAGLTDDCAVDELCLDIGLCAKRSYEQRACARACGGNNDCRAGYECRLAGTRGSMVLSNDPNATARFCAPVAP